MTADLLLADVAAARDLNAVEARGLVDSIRVDVADIGERIGTAYLGRAWIALGYASWDALCEAEFDGARLRIPREQRAEQVQSLRAAGLSTRAIGAALGIGKGTVDRDLATAPDGAVEPAATVQSLDGRTRPATQPPRPQTLTQALVDPALPVGVMLPVSAASVPADLRWADWRGRLFSSWQEMGAPADGCRFGCKLFARRQGCTIRYAVMHSLTYGHSHSPSAR